MKKTCEWLEGCDRPAVGIAMHLVHGLTQVCGEHRDLFQIPVIKTYTNSEN